MSATKSSEYHRLAATTYDLFHPTLSERELAFWRGFIERGAGPALDIGVGTGRTLLPLLRAGFDVDGVDLSPDMLAVCRVKAEHEGFAPRLYEQPMQKLEVERRYATMFIPYASFQLLPTREDAEEALRRFHAHLRPGGQLLIETYLPTDYDSAVDAGQWILARVGTRPDDGARVYVSRAAWTDHVEQVENVFWRYEIFKDNVLVECRNQEIALRMYNRDELAAMMRRADFEIVEVYGDHLMEPVRDGHRLMIVHATRP